MYKNFRTLAKALNPFGITAQLMRPYQLVISWQSGPVWPDRGNSFWVTWFQEKWYISTWSPRVYEWAGPENVVDFCVEFVSVGSSVVMLVPDDLIAKYQLHPLTEPEKEDLFAKLSEQYPSECEGDEKC